jgi:hypothetical protein
MIFFEAWLSPSRGTSVKAPVLPTQRMHLILAALSHPDVPVINTQAHGTCTVIISTGGGYKQVENEWRMSGGTPISIEKWT